MEKYRVGVIGGTGMVGQRFVTLLENHPWFQLTAIAASSRSAGKTYEEAIGGRWALDVPMPGEAKDMVVLNAETDIDRIAAQVDFVFSAVDMKKEEIQALEEAYARRGCPVVSNNSAHRWTPDVPMVVPEINPEHLRVIEAQRRRLGTERGFIAVKSNCSLQSYVPALHPLRAFGLEQVLEDEPEYQWLWSHCADYGFILRFPKGKEDVTGIHYEPWHFRYVGVEHAREITRRGITLEEYLAQA